MKLLCKETQDSEVFRLRYQVYVNEKKYMEEGSNNVKNGLVQDELDKTAHIFGVYCENKLVASARYNCTLNGSQLEALEMFSEYKNWMKNKIGKEFRELSLIEISRIVIDEKYRNTYAVPILFFEIFEHAVTHYAIDGMVYKIRKDEELLKSLYLNFNCKIIEDSVKNIQPYGNETSTAFLFGYMIIKELNLDLNEQKIYKILKRIGGSEYTNRIMELSKKIQQVKGDKKYENL
jgi:hypothetical protein